MNVIEHEDRAPVTRIDEGADTLSIWYFVTITEVRRYAVIDEHHGETLEDRTLS